MAINRESAVVLTAEIENLLTQKKIAEDILADIGKRRDVANADFIAKKAHLDFIKTRIEKLRETVAGEIIE